MRITLGMASLLAGATLGWLAGLVGAQEAAAPDRLTFDWPVPGRVGVRERTEKKGQTALTAYDLVIERAADGRRLRVRYENFRFLEVGGQDATRPEVQERIAQATAMAGALPAFLIAPGGGFEDAEGMEETVERALDGLRQGAAKEMEEERWAALREMMTSPQMLAQMKSKVGDHWRVWVGLWAGLELAPGGVHEAMTPLAMPDGSSLDAVVRIRHDGAAGAEAPGVVRLSAESSLCGEAARAALGRMVKDLAERMGRTDAPPPEEMFEDFRRDFKATAETDPKTLRPRRVTTESVATVKEKGKAAVAQREVHEYTFAWGGGK
ncbi:MAG: hypothetical protein HZA54_11820 [Planctomycetes bacterium]|nr:hypothetical protein [Planctomycetota bacterium]